MRITAEAKSATRERILDAASRLFRSEGWESTTTRDIAAAAGIAAGTLFNYFQTKEAIAATLVSDALTVQPEGAASLEEELFSFIWSGLRSLRKLRGFLAAAAETLFSPLARKAGESAGDSIRVGQLETMQRMAAVHGFVTPLSPVTVQLYWTLYLGVFSFWAADESPHQEDTLALLDQSLKLFVASLSFGSQVAGEGSDMNAKISELLAAMPGDLSEPGVPRDRLLEILADISRRPVPTGSVHRLWSLSDLSAQVALAYFAWWARQLFDGAEASERRLMETNLAVALKIFHRLGYLRGMLTKLGQAAGALPHLLPDDVVATLERLHFDAPPMHYSLIREVLRDELGAEPEEVFASFEQQAFAAASLGQVHRARLKSGELVAVKIQYPGIARTIDADFRNLGALLFPFRFGKGWDDLKVIFEEVRRMLHQEVDYEQEAEALRRARALFRSEDGIVVPQVYPEYSTKRVLTTEFLVGQHLDAFLATNPTQDLCNDFGTKLYHAWVRFYYGRMGYGDPHSGNYIFMEAGRLGLIDFGCVQNYSAEEHERVRFSDRLRDAPEESPAFIQRSLTLPGDDPDLETYFRLTEDYVNWVSQPLDPGPFDFGDARHLQRGVDWLGRIVRQRRTPIHPMYFYWNRSVFGLNALLYRLRAQVDVSELMKKESRIMHRRGEAQ